MMEQQINERYRLLCERCGVAVSIETVTQADAPAYQLQKASGCHIIRINRAAIPPSSYESFLGYVVSLVLLPELVLQTERLELRRFRMDDAAACFPLMSDDEGMYLDGCKAFPVMDEAYWERMTFFAQQEGQYVIVLRSTNEVIGAIKVFADDTRAVESREIGYDIAPGHRRNGYAFEALSALLRLLQQELLLDMVTAGVLPENMPSIRLLEKLGFHREGIRHKALWHEALDQPVDMVYYYRDR